jgi:hypothetical protein
MRMSSLREVDAELGEGVPQVGADGVRRDVEPCSGGAVGGAVGPQVIDPAGAVALNVRGGSLTVDGLCCCDQFVGPRLASAGQIAAAGSQLGPARLTASGRALLRAA